MTVSPIGRSTTRSDARALEITPTDREKTINSLSLKTQEQLRAFLETISEKDVDLVLRLITKVDPKQRDALVTKVLPMADGVPPGMLGAILMDPSLTEMIAKEAKLRSKL